MALFLGSQMHSMTGYGSSAHKSRQLEIEVHVKSVNGRYLDLRFHLPKEYAPLESELKGCFDNSWRRGTVDIYVHRRLSSDAKMGGGIRLVQAESWAKTLRALNKKLKIQQDITLRDVLAMPFVIETQDRSPLLDQEMKVLKAQIRDAAKGAQAFRKREGNTLKKELLNLLAQLEKCIKQMLEWRGQAQGQLQARLQTRIESFATSDIDPARLAVESALMADRMDVQEELVRLGEHIQSCRKLIQDGAAQGKKLDFFCQELLREVNTVGSKSGLAGLTQTVVEAKSIIEKFREQVQNIE